MQVTRTDSLPITAESDLVLMRQAVRTWAQELSFSVVDLTKLVTAASELGRNTLIHGKGGEVTLQVLQDEGRRGLRLTFEDRGPGIASIERAMEDGYTTGTGLGLGLGGAKRLVGEFDIDSRVGEGTRIIVTRWR